LKPPCRISDNGTLKMDLIVVRGARTHNLQSVDVDIPRGRLVVVTGPSGSGKSSLAFNTIYAEGRRRYVESLSVYARQLLGPIARPDVDHIEGLSPAIAIEQRTLARNPRSTVGTVTEIDDYLRLLFARAAQPFCPQCGKAVRASTVSEIVDQVLALGDGARVSLMAPAVRAQRGAHADLLEAWRREGFVRARIDGAQHDLGEEITLDPKRPHDIDLVIDRVAVKDGVRARVLDAVELALKHGQGLVRVVPTEGDELLVSERFACADCGITLPPIEPPLFSFNSPSGACQVCGGLGVREVADLPRLVPDPSLSLSGGALAPWKKALPRELETYARGIGVDLYAPWQSLPARARDEILYGDGDAWPGILSLLDRKNRVQSRTRGRDEELDEDNEEAEIRGTTEAPCDACKGTRLRPEALSVRLAGKTVADLSALSLRDLRKFCHTLDLPARVRPVVERVQTEIVSRLQFLDDVGVSYLSLSRPAATLSGGEGQRVRLATQIGSALVGVLYVLDEPSVGLHPRDSARLLNTLRALVYRGNSVLVVEHDLETIRAADWVIDLGPGAGAQGGKVVAVGTPADLAKNPDSVTGPYLAGTRQVGIPAKRRDTRTVMRLKGARLHNLQNVSIDIPLGCLVAITGVSGSGKSSLILGTLVPHLRARLNRTETPNVPIDALEGVELVERLVAVDATPLGRTPRSSPATYMGVFALLREVFAQVPEARARGFKPGRFSFNVKGGRCESCEGDGVLRVEMHFLPDVMVPCEACGGSRYERETLTVKYRGYSIADVLSMTVDEAIPVFDALPRVRDLLLTLRDVGLGYVHLGQPATTLSGGEAQRVKLARELARKTQGRTLYVLDEPTTGLHLRDTETLLALLEKLVDQGNTVVIIEHQLDVVKRADWVIDVGPDGGDAGGRIVAAGTPELIAATPNSLTGVALAPLLQEAPIVRKTERPPRLSTRPTTRRSPAR
jgi:excinuclease ABC subunit A